AGSNSLACAGGRPSGLTVAGSNSLPAIRGAPVGVPRIIPDASCPDTMGTVRQSVSTGRRGRLDGPHRTLVVEVGPHVFRGSAIVHGQQIPEDRRVALPGQCDHATPRSGRLLDARVHAEVAMPPARRGIGTGAAIARADRAGAQV